MVVLYSTCLATNTSSIASQTKLAINQSELEEVIIILPKSFTSLWYSDIRRDT
jgi:hypothetical protein